MRLEFVYSKSYFRNLNKYKPVNRKFEEVIKIGKSFENIYSSEIKKIIKLIPEVMNAPWKEKSIKVYIVDWPGPSFSHPLTLKVREDLLLMLFILTHELLHYFFIEKPLEGKEKEEKIDEKVKEIFDILRIDVKEQLETLHEFHEKRFNKKE